MGGNRAELWDYVDLALLHIAKIGRRKLSAVAETESFYGDFFTENDVQVMCSGGDLRRKYRGEILRDAALRNMPAKAAVLDVGCGTGDNLRYILRDSASFVGLEYAETTASIARSVLDGRAEVRTGSATSMPFNDNSFHLALCIEVLEHIEDDEKACREVARVIKPGGALILSLPYRHWFPSYFHKMGHFRHYTRSDVVALLARHGLTVVEYLPNFPRWSRFANYLYILCRIYALVLRVFGARRSPVEASLPFSRRSLMGILFSKIDEIRQREESADLATLETSTFVVARKVGVALVP